MTPETSSPNEGASAHDREQLLSLYRQMLVIRRFEEKVNELYLSAVMPGIAHLCIGQEATAVGVCSSLRSDDYITSTHRGHGHCLAKGAAIDRMFAELLGRRDGYCGGKGGSMHIADPATANLGANAIVGGSLAIAAGAALSAQRQGNGRVVASFFGDGALGQGVLYETMNMASLWALPVVFVCENNQYVEYTAHGEVTAGSVLGRAQAFAISAEEVDGQDVLAVRKAALAAAERARAGQGPSFLACRTYRFHGHHVGDIDRAYYRSKDEEAEWRLGSDPLERFAESLEHEGTATTEELAAIDALVQEEIEAGVEFALQSPFPLVSEAETNVFA
jgi:pyruvate dehydrogenase E1 component alpha subunit